MCGYLGVWLRDRGRSGHAPFNLERKDEFVMHLSRGKLKQNRFFLSPSVMLLNVVLVAQHFKTLLPFFIPRLILCRPKNANRNKTKPSS